MMMNRFTRFASGSSLALALFTVTLILIAPITNAQEARPTQTATTKIVVTKAHGEAKPASESVKVVVAPVWTDYRGVRIGMSADEVRHKLDHQKEKSDQQDYFAFSDTESAQVYYDDKGKVTAISVNYLGNNAGAPAPKAVIGEEIQAKPDGSMYKLVRYPAAGYWVAYYRTAGDAPLVTVTMQKIQ